MQSQLTRVLRTEFHKKMAATLPAFSKTKTAFGGLIYRKRDDTSGRYIFLFLYPSPKYDRFTVEFAASASPDFPFGMLPGDRPSDGGARTRIRSFLEQKSDGWWRANKSDELLEIAALMNLRSGEQVAAAAARIPQLVNDVFVQLQPALSRFLIAVGASPNV